MNPADSPIPKQEHRRLAWQCRRGMLELDELLGAFLRKEYPRLSAAEQRLFRSLLEESDPELFTWLFAKAEEAPPAYAALIRRIRQTRG